MLDTSYGFNNLLKEVIHFISLFRGINISQVSNRLSLKTLTLVKKLQAKLKDPLAPMVNTFYILMFKMTRGYFFL